ncbi:hypothetical protein ANME2D_03001 [Candidatus Methanoperedens nitroreducens]|uniref:Uncharacterized protein n=1 Tax=Candidatus Methanoperedens nitratireducens TaxID=1392998 RepID=A0A062V0T9_9EURY|nr:hypothetical protein [Candidatus Methanoperedens nitroreducens]KCZ70972.1 hypothetical protein ANME2D_03001 [Candidatus Methanoperedens nitroreducens]MDJ1421659.1 hypothetical protein [Candidatus Methanoperedens sp.]
MQKQTFQVDKKIKALEEQIELLKSFISKKEPLVTIEDYRKYLAKTKKAVVEYIEPTEYIRKTRVKGEFY